MSSIQDHFSFKGILTIAVLVIVGPIIVRGITARAYAAESQTLPDENVVFSAYQDKIAKETDLTKLTHVGQSLMDLGLYNYAALNFKRASDLDPNFRDVAYAWAYCLLQDKQHTITTDDLKQVHVAIARAEAVDPLFVPLLKLKLVIAQVEKDDATTKTVQDRLALLKTAQ